MKAVLLFLVSMVAAYGQVASATLAGTVEDQSSAAIAGAAVTAAQKSTGFARSAVTDGRGSYVLDQLAPGEYTVSVRKPGFQEYSATRIVLEVNQKARYDVRLAVGTGQEQITVTAAVSPLNTDDAAIGYRMDNSKILDLPLQSRNVVSLATLGPGAVPRQLGGFVHDVYNDVQEGTRGSVALNPPINGGRSSMNTFLLDGAYDTDRNTFAIAVYPPMDSVREFHIQSTLAPAEFPQSGGGAVDVVTKSGTRDFHGSGFGYLRNEATDARNFFDAPGPDRPIFRQQQFGAALGGPMPLWKNTYFFGIYEGLRRKSGNSRLSIVPDQNTRAGDFSGQSTIYDPLTGAPFPGNRIPQARIDPIAAAYLSKYEPLPNLTGGTSNYKDATPNEDVTDSASGRLDHSFGNRGLLTGRYTLNREENRLAGSFPVLPASEQVRAQQVALGYTRSAASWLNEARFSFTRLRLFDVPESAFHVNVEQELGLANPPSDPFQFGVPFFNVTNYSLVTDSPTLPQVQRDNLWHASDTVSLQRGRHTWKFGADFVRFELNYLQSNLSRGRYDYTGVFSSADGSGVGSGDALADFLLGYPQASTRTRGSGQAYLRQNVWSGFAQDDWRVSPRLTVNFGVRYEYIGPYSEARNNLLNLDYSTLPQAPRLVRVQHAVEPDRNNFGPRVGIAWQVPRVARTVFRAGYGVYYSAEIASESYDLILNSLENEQNQTQGNRPPILTTRDAFPKTASTGFPSYFGVDAHARTPYTQQWTGSLQHEFAGRTLLEVAYIGSKGTKLGRYRQFNTPAHVETGENLPPRPGDLQALRTFPALGRILQRQHISNSTYNSLQVKAERSLSSRFSLLASFVWSKSIDDAGSIIQGLYDSVAAQDERNLRLERGLSFTNPGRRISAGYVYRWRKWTLSGTVTLQDGTPENPFYFVLDFANSGTPNRPDIVPGQSPLLPRSQRTADHFINTAAFTAPAPYTFGNAGRNTIIGPGNNIFDLALQREFRLRESHTIRVRAESFNIFNHPNWGIAGNNPDFGPFFGKIFTSGDPRRMQFALRYDF
jgi:hypothetical protein